MGSSTSNSGPTNTLDITTDLPIYIGDASWSHKIMYLDEVELFNRALTPAEINQIWDKGKKKP